MAETKTTRIWIGQPLHFACLVVLLIPVYFAWESLGESFPALFWGAVAAPVMHQVYVWLAWRLEIQSMAISKTIGFRAYVVMFFVLFSSRFVSLLTLAWVDRGSMNLNVIPVTILTVILASLGIYAMYSVKRYFGMARAAGADHFDSRYRNISLVNKGIFRFTNNGMYLYAFLLFWAIAVGFNSTLALTVAAFSHVYIWVHFYATEKPDMEYLHNADNNRMQSDAAEPRR